MRGSQTVASQEAPCRGGRRSLPVGRPGTPPESSRREINIIKHYSLMPTLYSKQNKTCYKKKPCYPARD